MFGNLIEKRARTDYSALRLALRVALKGDQLRQTAKLSNRLDVCREFELNTSNGIWP